MDGLPVFLGQRTVVGDIAAVGCAVGAASGGGGCTARETGLIVELRHLAFAKQVFPGQMRRLLPFLAVDGLEALFKVGQVRLSVFR